MPERVRPIKKRKKINLNKKRFLLSLFIIFFFFFIWQIFAFYNKEGINQNLDVIGDRKAVALVCVSTECVPLNKDGIAFSKSPKPTGSLFFLIEKKKGDLIVGERVLEEETFLELLFLKRKMEDNLSLNTIKATQKEESVFYFQTREGWQIKIDLQNNANATLEILERVLNEIGSARFSLEYIDLRLPNKVFYKLTQ